MLAFNSVIKLIKLFFVEAPFCANSLRYVNEHSVLVARVIVVNIQVLFVEIFKVAITKASKTEHDISGFTIDGRAHKVDAINPQYVNVHRRKPTVNHGPPTMVNVVVHSFEHGFAYYVDDRIVVICFILLFNSGEF